MARFISQSSTREPGRYYDGKGRGVWSLGKEAWALSLRDLSPTAHIQRWARGSHRPPGAEDRGCALPVALVPDSSPGFPGYQMPSVSNFFRISGLSVGHEPEPKQIGPPEIDFLFPLLFPSVTSLFTQISNETE